MMLKMIRFSMTMQSNNKKPHVVIQISQPRLSQYEGTEDVSLYRFSQSMHIFLAFIYQHPSTLRFRNLSTQNQCSKLQQKILMCKTRARRKDCSNSKSNHGEYLATVADNRSYQNLSCKHKFISGTLGKKYPPRKIWTNNVITGCPNSRNFSLLLGMVNERLT